MPSASGQAMMLTISSPKLSLLFRLSFLTDITSADLWNPVTSPRMKDVWQGTTGSCWLAATMASKAYTDLDHLQNTTHEDSSGTVLVTLYDGATPSNYSVTKPTWDETQYSDGCSYCVWPALIEKAVHALAVAHHDTGIFIDPNDGGWPNDALKVSYGPTLSTGPVLYCQGEL